MSQVTEQSVRFQTAWPSIKLIQASAVLDLTEDDFYFPTIDKVWIAAVIAYYVHTLNIQTACLIMEGAEFTENIINGVERPVKAAELFAFTLRVRAGNTDVL